MENDRKKMNVVPGIDGAPRPIAPPETAGCATADGIAMQPARGVGTGAGEGWKGYTREPQQSPAP